MPTTARTRCNVSSLLQDFARLYGAPGRPLVGTAAAVLLAPSEAEREFERRLAALKARHLRELQRLVSRDRLQKILMRPFRAIRRIGYRHVVRRVRSTRTPALADPDPDQAISSRSLCSRPWYDMRRGEAFSFAEHQNENARPPSRALSRRNDRDGRNTTTTRRVA